MVYSPMDKREYEERYGEEVGTCNTHKVTVVDRDCPQCEEEYNEEWRCKECGDVRHNDPFIENGKKCYVCTYTYQGGE